MKYIVFVVMGIIGAMSVGLLILKHADYIQSYEKMIRREFGSPEAIQILSALYARVEREGSKLGPVGSQYREIPDEWLPEKFALKWSTKYCDTSQVVARFDEKGVLMSIEFDGPRCGCHISKDPTLGPREFKSLHRIAVTPLFFTARVSE